MSDISSLRDTIVPKSDRINADNLLAGPETFRISGVKRGDADSPMRVEIEGSLPWFPCKSMRRVLITAWGDDGREWVGRSLTLYTDPEVKFGGVKVGGLRISHMSDIDRDIAINLTTTRGKRAAFTVKKLSASAASAPVDQPNYPDELFGERLPAMKAAILAGKMTPQQVIDRCSKTGKLTQQQIDIICATHDDEEM